MGKIGARYSVACLFAGIFLISLAIHYFDASEIFILKTDRVFAGELWRMFSGHLVHLNTAHFLLNFLALLLIFQWSLKTSQTADICVFLLVAAPLVSLGLIISGAQWYAGLSGLLHGALVVLIMRLRFPLQFVGLCLVLGKLVLQANLPERGFEAGVDPISHVSHWIGAGLGVIYGAFGGKARTSIN